jgi:hypothetical protein
VALVAHKVVPLHRAERVGLRGDEPVGREKHATAPRDAPQRLVTLRGGGAVEEQRADVGELGELAAPHREH